MYRPILLLALAATAALSPADQQNFWTKPDIHGDMAVFTCEGDLWLGSIKDHTARRITNHPGTETWARFSPDGTMVAFTANYDGGTDVYVMPVDGGSPKRLTYDPANAQVMSWTPDGKFVVFRSRRNNPPGGHNKLYEVPVDGGQSTALPIPQGEFGDIAGNGQLAYVPSSAEWMNWFHYQGGAADDIWLADLNTHKFTQLTTSPNIDTTPTWCDGNIYYVSQSEGTSNLFEVDPSSKATKEVTHFELPVRYPGSDADHVIFELGPGLGIYDPKTGDSQKLSFDLNSDEIHSRETRMPLAPEVTRAAIGPSGKRILVEARGQIWSVAAENGDARVVENQPGARSIDGSWSPDGKTIAFISDRSSENQVWTVPAVGGTPTKLTTTLKGEYSPLVWSPDGNWLATVERSTAINLINAKTGEVQQLDISPNYSSYDSFSPDVRFSPDSKLLAYTRIEDNWNLAVWAHDIAANKNVLVSDTTVNSFGPAFTPDGKFLAFLCDREFHAAPTNPTGFAVDNTTRVTLATLAPDVTSPFLPKNDEEGTPEAAKPADAPKVVPNLDGIQLRTINVPMPAARYSKIIAVGGRLLVLDRTAGPLGDGGPTQLIAFDIDKAKTTTLNSNVDDVEAASDGKKILVMHGATPCVLDVATGPFDGNDGAVALGSYTLTVEPKEEWKQIFHESWRIARDFFYDPGMHGLDWNAVEKDYESRLAYVGDRSDLSRLLKDMVSELNVGHEYITDPTPPIRRVPVGYLGADLEQVAGQDAVRIKRILRGSTFDLTTRSPLLEPGLNVHEGDYVVSVAGQPIKRDQDIQALLIGTPGQVVAVGINSQPSMVGARIIRVKPLSSESVLRYSDWVEGRREYVRTHGGADLGYLHMTDMSAAGLTQFSEGHFPNVFKNGMIYDTRDNGGGYISSLILQDIASKPQIFWHPRYGAPWAREGWAPIGYKVAIGNGGNFSDGELFLETWRRLKVGPIVGTRTGGGEVGSGGGYNLIDHGQIYVSNYGAYSSEGGWVIEGKGVTPDYTVEQDPTAVMAGKDPQLDKAIELMEAMIKKSPPHRPATPPFPNKVYKPRK
jgi:tricorn protease